MRRLSALALSAGWARAREAIVRFWKSGLGRKRPILKAVILGFLLLVTSVASAGAYSVLSHEAIIDSAWDTAIKPLLLSRFPNATPEDLKTAHAYAYGGAIIQDMGYYPFGSKLFSDLLHYVRTADFIEALVRDSKDLNDYAFALGALAHYVADNDGHRLAVNRTVPMVYPKLRQEYGDVVTYDQNPSAHLKTEFGFDVLQVAKGHYAPQSYHDYVGFEVSNELLENAFRDTYCLDLKSTFLDYDLAVATYRHGVSSVIPGMTRAAWQIKKDEIQKEIPGITRRTFIYNISKASYRKEWSQPYKKPGLGARIFAFLINLIPKVGPFRALSFRVPPPQAEQLFMTSFNATLADYAQVVQTRDANGVLEIKNDNLDTGTTTTPGEYPLADQTYAQLVERLEKNHFAQTSPELRTVILSYYGNLSAPFATKKKKSEWNKLVQDIDELRATGSQSASAALP